MSRTQPCVVHDVPLFTCHFCRPSARWRPPFPAASHPAFMPPAPLTLLCPSGSHLSSRPSNCGTLLCRATTFSIHSLFYSYVYFIFDSCGEGGHAVQISCVESVYPGRASQRHPSLPTRAASGLNFVSPQLPQLRGMNKNGLQVGQLFPVKFQVCLKMVQLSKQCVPFSGKRVSSSSGVPEGPIQFCPHVGHGRP